MMQKIIVGALALTLIGAAGVAYYDATQTDSAADSTDVLAQPSSDVLAVEAANSENQVELDAAQPDVAPQVALEPTPTGEALDAVASADPAPLEQQQALDMVGDPWTGTGTISALDTAGITLVLDNGKSVYIELGPSHFWAGQGVTLTVGDRVSINGFYNGEQIHAATLTRTADGAQIAVRTAEGVPLWAGGAGQQGTITNDAGTGESQVAAQDWQTITGTVTAVNASALTMQSDAGEGLGLPLGRADFWQSQGVTFVPGDAISVLGFWQGTTFQPGEIVKTATGERLMLRDPNGRSLSAGPGRSGANASGQGQGQGQGQGNQGQGNQGGGGQGQGQGNQAPTVQVPAAQWETLSGTVFGIEPLALTLQLQDGTIARVGLGQVDFWTGQGINFSANAVITVDGYWLNDQFEAGEVQFEVSGVRLYIRDQDGRLLWQDDSSQAQGQGQGNQQGQGQGNQGSGNGNGYRGGR